MTPFQEFRLWARRAPAGERAGAGVAAALVLAVLVWVLVPAFEGTATPDALGLSATSATGNGAAGTTTGDAPAGGDAPDGRRTGTAGSGGAVARLPGTGLTAAGARGGALLGTTSGPAGSTGGAAARAASCPAGAATGLTAQRVDIAVIRVNIVGPASNTVFGGESPEQQQTYFQATIDDVNARGGAGCRQIVPHYFDGNPVDQSDLQQKCLEITSKPYFAVLDLGAFATHFPLVSCFARNHMPYFVAYGVPAAQVADDFPFVFGFYTLDRLVRNTVFALRDRGFFSPSHGFEKLGYIYRSCDPALISAERTWLAQVGVPAAQMITYDVGCPDAFANPSDIQQAVLKFKAAGVTNVTTASFVGDFGTFTKVAQQQKFKPAYGLPDDSLIPLTYGSASPDHDNIAGAIAITATRAGEERTPGTRPSPGSRQCNAVLAKQHLGTVYSLTPAAGNICDLVWMFDAAMDHAPALRPQYLAAGLQAARSIDFSYPQGPTDFSGQGVTTGGEFWRPNQFRPGCGCWQLLNRAFAPSFPDRLG